MRFEIVMRVFFSDYFQKEFHARLDNNLVAPEGKNHVICYVPKEWHRFVQALYTKACRDLRTFRHYAAVIRKEQRRYVTVGRRLASGNLKALGFSELKRRYVAFDQLHLEFFNKPIWIPFPIEPVLSSDAEKALHEALQHQGNDVYQRYFTIFFSPHQMNAITREHVALLQVALRIKKGCSAKRRGQLLQRHVRTYQWLPCYDINDAPWGKQEFSLMLAKILRQPVLAIRRELRTTVDSFRKRARAYETALATLPLTPKQRMVLQMANALSFIKDERDDYRRMGSFAIQPLFQEIGRRADLPIKAITQCTRQEMVRYLTTGQMSNSTKQKLRERMTHGYVLLRKRGSATIRVYEGAQARTIARRELGEMDASNVTEIDGIIGSTGKASGRVQIVSTKHDLRKVQIGDVMVAVTTHPDFVPAMRRCSAIVTDEGGITCHAAIVSREMRKPCVVGTKIATKALRDGDRAEVDASNGVVRKI